MHDAVALREAFSERDWATGEDYVLQDRVSALRRYGDAIAGRVRGARADYWVRLSLTLPPVSACECGRPRCRHAAALVQAYLSRRVAVSDAGQAVQRFLAAPHAAPLAAAILGEDLLGALSLPPADLPDIWALPDAERVLALDAALRTGGGTRLLRDVLRRPDLAGPAADWLEAALLEARLPPSEWLTLYAAADGRFAQALFSTRPHAFTEPDVDRAVGHLYMAAAAGDLSSVDRFARLVATVGSRRRALRALQDLAPGHPAVARTLVGLAAGGAELRWALGIAERAETALQGEERRELVSAALAAARQDPPLFARLQLRQAAREGGRRDLMQARRAAISAGVWTRLRRSLPHLLSHRADGIVREVEIWLADGDLPGAASAAARSEASHLPDRLVGDALREKQPAQALRHYLRARRIAEAHGLADALLDGRIAELRAAIGAEEQVAPRDRRS